MATSTLAVRKGRKFDQVLNGALKVFLSDGFEGASFLQEVKRYLEDPTLLLLAGI